MRGRRTGLAAAIVFAVLVPATAASAQYGPASTTTSAAPTTTETTVDPGSGGPADTEVAPPPNQVPGEVSDNSVVPGAVIEVSAPSIRDEPVFDADEPIAAGLARTNPDGSVETVDLVPVLTIDGNNTVRVTVQIPVGTPTDRIYTVFVVGTNPDGATRTIIVDIVVRAEQPDAGAEYTAAQQPGDAPPTAPYAELSSTVAVPNGVTIIQPLTAAQEAAYVSAVVDDAAEVRIEGTRLVLYRPEAENLPVEDPPYAAAVAAVAIGGGAVLALRRKPSVLSARRSVLRARRS